MSKKARAIFLSVSFAVFVLSVGISLILTGISYRQARNSNSEFAYMDIALTDFILYLCIIPVLINELSWIRSTYKLLKYRPEQVKKVCYIISSSLSFFVITLFWALPIGGNLFVMSTEMQSFLLEILVFLCWPAVFVSFILGSIPVRKRKGAGGASIGDAPPADPAAETRPENSDAE